MGKMSAGPGMEPPGEWEIAAENRARASLVMTSTDSAHEEQDVKRTGTVSVVLVVLAAACSGGGTAPTTEAAATTETTTTEATATTEPTSTGVQPSPGAMVMVTTSSLGPILADGDGNTLYIFTPDEQGESVCYDQCEANWPPLTGDVEAGDGLEGSLLGTAPRQDGTRQVTYNGWPLYYFAGDAASGDVNGQGVNDVWYVMSPEGGAIRAGD